MLLWCLSLHRSEKYSFPEIQGKQLVNLIPMPCYIREPLEYTLDLIFFWKMPPFKVENSEIIPRVYSLLFLPSLQLPYLIFVLILTSISLVLPSSPSPSAIKPTLALLLSLHIPDHNSVISLCQCFSCSKHLPPLSFHLPTMLIPNLGPLLSTNNKLLL